MCWFKYHHLFTTLFSQLQKPESVYAVPQLLPRPPVHAGGTRGTGQSVLTDETSNINNTALSNSTDSDDTSVMQVNSSCSSSDAVTSVVRARSDSNTSNRQLNAALSNSTSDQMVVVTAGQNSKIPVFKSGYLNGKKQTTFSNPHSTRSLSTAQIVDNIKNVNGSVQLSNEDELMEDDSVITGLDENIMEANAHNQNNCTDKIVNNKQMDIISHTVNSDQSNEEIIDVDCKPPLILDKKPESLDVLAKNAINANGLSPECVKIIHAPGPKIDLKGIAQELTTTFKPVESAI